MRFFKNDCEQWEGGIFLIEIRVKPEMGGGGGGFLVRGFEIFKVSLAFLF